MWSNKLSFWSYNKNLYHLFLNCTKIKRKVLSHVDFYFSVFVTLSNSSDPVGYWSTIKRRQCLWSCCTFMGLTDSSVAVLRWKSVQEFSPCGAQHPHHTELWQCDNPSFLFASQLLLQEMCCWFNDVAVCRLVVVETFCCIWLKRDTTKCNVRIKLNLIIVVRPFWGID